MLELLEDISVYYNQLLGLLYNHSFNYSEKPKFKLAYKDELSKFYVNSRNTTLLPEGMILVGSIITKKIAEMPQKINGIGGLTFGADPISISSATISNLVGQKLYAFSIRKELKTHGVPRWIEGEYDKGDRVVIVDDVVTTGKSTRLAIQRAQDAGLKVEKVFVLVDRQEEEGLKKIKDMGVDVEAIFTIKDLMNMHYDRTNQTKDDRTNQTQDDRTNQTQATSQQWALSG